MKRALSLAICLTGIAVMAAAMVIGPFFAPPEFSWVRHTTSEQAGQSIDGAPIMRLGFACYGAGTLLAALIDHATRPLVRAALGVFGLGLVGVAVWSNASILPGVVSDMHEDRMHSIAANIVGISFAAACAARLFAPGGRIQDALSWGGLVISVAVPLAMVQFPDLSGLLQRVMFAVSFVFVACEFGSRVGRAR